MMEIIQFEWIFKNLLFVRTAERSMFSKTNKCMVEILINWSAHVRLIFNFQCKYKYVKISNYSCNLQLNTTNKDISY